MNFLCCLKSKEKKERENPTVDFWEGEFLIFGEKIAVFSSSPYCRASEIRST